MRNIHTTPTRLFIWLLPLALSLHGCSNDTPEEANRDETPAPALLIAAENGDLPTLTRLIEGNDAVIDVKDACFWTPLMKAALNGHTKVVERLILAGADINQKDKGGYSSTAVPQLDSHKANLIWGSLFSLGGGSGSI
ncbi:MAG: ankyrin repeat domain-containing protein, partial [Candidatus Thiodiazotropha endolucinida]|nr:ankyrin repeat domain-containing protein [Candidatus Thiodiazotropha endolucinida]